MPVAMEDVALVLQHGVRGWTGRSATERYTTECASFTGFPVSCAELQSVRGFNREVMRGMRTSSSASVRKAMNRHGLPGHVWHVGHACPDPSKSSARDVEDYGWNLFATHILTLGHYTS